MAQVKTSIDLNDSWLNQLKNEFGKPYMHSLNTFLLSEKKAGKVIYPKDTDILRALNLTTFEKVKVVIVGQDPYHGEGQAHGLSFSVPKGVKTPPSLMNIYKEINEDLGFSVPQHGNLEHWANQGVLLLNSVLTVEHQLAASHKNRGWETFTDAIIERLASERKHIVFLLWGSYAQSKGKHIDSNRHCILKAPHPSPLSAHRGFLGCKHFSKANAYLTQTKQTSIDWSIPE